LNAWIEVKLDPRVRVTAIDVSCGFDKGDLFEKNLRIKKLRVERDGALVREVDLDPEIRPPQRIAVDLPGGTYKLTVLETKPGTNAAWREVVVSELKFLGTAPPDVFRPEARLPKMTVAPGSAKAPLPAELWAVELTGREGANLAAVCAAWKADVLAVVKKAQAAGQGLEGYDPNRVTCASEAAPRLEGELPLGWAVTSAAAVHFFDGVAVKDDKYLVFRRPDGATVAGPMYSTGNDIGDSPRPAHYRVAMATSKGQPALFVASSAAWHSPYDPGPDPDSLEVETVSRACRFEVTRFTCDPPRTLTKKLDGRQAAAFKARPIVELPPDAK
jgi:hypothetical protein